MDLWLDGLKVLAEKGWVIFGILLMIIWGQILISNMFQKILGDRLTRAEYFSLGMSGWILPVALAAGLLFGGTFLFGRNMDFAVLILAMVVLLLTRRSASDSFLVYSILVIFLSVSLILHLAFLQKTIFPLYFDSAEHYRIIRYFLECFSAFQGGSLPAWPLINYYHVGYHFLTASISIILKTNILDVMLVFGQILVSVLPLSLFFIVRRETGSNSAALFTSLLAGFGWHMPGHALNWGKYPALFSLLCIQFVLCVVYLIFRDNTCRSERVKLFLILGFGILASGFVHTRSLIVYAFLFLSLLLFLLWKRLPVIYQRVAFLLALGILALEIGCTRADGVLEILLNTYIRNDLLVTCLILFLAIFSMYEFTDITFFSLVFLCLLLLGLFIPLGGLFLAYGNQVLLDRPYVQMLLYIPLSILGGLGFAGLLRFVGKISFYPKLLPQFVTVLVFGYVAIHAAYHYDFYPSDCCQIVGRDDLTAFTWIDKNLPLEMNILIASTGMYVTSAEVADAQSGVDGGVWITPLISRTTIPMSGELRFDQPDILDGICSSHAGYIYVGGEPQSFDDALLEGHPDWYQAALSLPGAKVYKVVGCK